MTDAEILELANSVFGAYVRPQHFTNASHCCECAEHDNLLLSRAHGQLRTEDVSNPGWNPICFVTNEAFLYLVPELMRLALQGPEHGDWSFPNLLFHLTYEAQSNRYLALFNPAERSVVTDFLRHLSIARSHELENYLEFKEV